MIFIFVLLSKPRRNLELESEATLVNEPFIVAVCFIRVVKSNRGREQESIHDGELDHYGSI
jgi:hypothetical protein